MAKHVWMTAKVRSHCLPLWFRWLSRSLELYSWYAWEGWRQQEVPSQAHLLPHNDLPVFFCCSLEYVSGLGRQAGPEPSCAVAYTRPSWERELAQGPLDHASSGAFPGCPPS